MVAILTKKSNERHPPYLSVVHQHVAAVAVKGHKGAKRLDRVHLARVNAAHGRRFVTEPLHVGPAEFSGSFRKPTVRRFLVALISAAIAIPVPPLVATTTVFPSLAIAPASILPPLTMVSPVHVIRRSAVVIVP